MKSARYLDTRGLDTTRPAFCGVVVKGIAAGGGLYVPEELPALTLPEILAFADWPYWRRAAALFSRFGVDMPPNRVDVLMRAAYGAKFDTPEVAPVREVRSDMHVLELWHGPTSAFKDMALQCMPLFFGEAVEADRRRHETEDGFLILVATSGDTGKAALEGFRDRKHTSIVVFYPAEGVSEIQRKQMVTQTGSNVGVFGVRGDFDDCQAAVKAAFADEDFNAELHERHRLRLSSANSINWGRLLPQIVYYVSAYADMVRGGGVAPGGIIDVCVPTGNFGNILAAYYARRMGVPIGRLVCASNENKVLADFFASGLYDVSSRMLVNTPSPSMDILVSSNLERLLYELAGAEAVREWMRQLAEEKRFQVDRETFARMREVFVGDFVTNDESLSVIERVYGESGYLLDPHTAVAWEVAERTQDCAPVLVVSTAHWAKFGVDVFKALRGLRYRDWLPEDLKGMTGVDLVKRVAQIAPGAACVPQPLAELDELPERFTEAVDAGREGVEGAVRGWLAAPRQAP
ncbi:MAG: threonine synthase [Coriobacteriia bacterium]|nr:threonine synthase [Coriobacteriia bacterium]